MLTKRADSKKIRKTRDNINFFRNQYENADEEIATAEAAIKAKSSDINYYTQEIKKIFEEYDKTSYEELGFSTDDSDKIRAYFPLISDLSTKTEWDLKKDLGKNLTARLVKALSSLGLTLKRP